jgi:hypothetical protein
MRHILKVYHHYAKVVWAERAEQAVIYVVRGPVPADQHRPYGPPPLRRPLYPDRR